MKINKSMIHWNGNQFAAIDVETTGLQVGYHEIIQLCLLPLDSNIKPRKDIEPFYINLKPEHLERIDPDAMRVNKIKLTNLINTGYDQECAKGLLELWFDKLGLPSTQSGKRKRLKLLGHNVNFDVSFVQAWLGLSWFEELFDSRFVDTQQVALYLNDRAAMHCNPIPYPKTSQSFLAAKLDVPHERAHDALQDCIVVAEIYRRFLQQGLLG